MVVEHLCSLSSVVEFKSPRPPRRVGKEIRCLSSALGALHPVRAGGNSFWMTSSSALRRWAMPGVVLERKFHFPTRSCVYAQ